MRKVPPKLHAAIVSWDGKHSAAKEIATGLDGVVEAVTVAYSNADGETETGPGNWIAVANEDYFGQKFKVLLDHVQPDETMLLIQADVTCRDWAELGKRCVRVLTEHPDLGVWSPTIDNTPFPNSVVATGVHSNDGLIDVLQSDAVVLALTQPVLDRLRTLDFSQNNLGWGIDWAAVAYSRLKGLGVVRDLSSTIAHPKSRGYGASLAETQMKTFLEQLTAEEKAAKSELETSIRARIAQRRGHHHLLVSNLQELKKTAGPAAPDLDALRQSVRSLHLSQGRLSVTLNGPACDVAVSSGEDRQTLVSAPDPAPYRILTLSPQAGEGCFVENATGTEWSCPGQATTSVVFLTNSPSARVPLIEPIELPYDLGDLYLMLGVAAHRADADLLVEWHDMIDLDCSGQEYVKLEAPYSGRNDLGDYQSVRVRIPATATSRMLRLSLCFWSGPPNATEPSVMLLTRPFLMSASEAERPTTPLMIIGSEAETGKRLAATLRPAEAPITLHIDDKSFPLVQPTDHATLTFSNGTLYAHAPVQRPVTLFVHGRASRMLWIGPEPIALNFPSATRSVSSGMIELRDMTGTVTVARLSHFPTCSSAKLEPT